MGAMYVKANSHRARQKLTALAEGPLTEYFALPGFTHYIEVPDALAERALAITGIVRGRPGGTLHRCWGGRA